MTPTKAAAASQALLSSPKRLFLSGFVVIVAVWAIQSSSDIPAEKAFSPVELSSNVVASMGLVWALLQLGTNRRVADFRRAWAAMATGMLLLTVEGYVGKVLMLRTHDPDEMGLSIAIWTIAAILILRGGRLFRPRRSVTTVLSIGLMIQLAAQYVGWLGALEQSDASAAEALQYVNDMGELTAVLAYVSGMLLAVFAPMKLYQFPPASIGRKGREIVRDFGLLDVNRYPTRNRWLRGWPMRWVVMAAIVVWYVARVAPQVRRGGGPRVTMQAFDLLLNALRGVNPHSYYLLELFRRENRVLADAYVTRVETKNGLTKRLQAHVRRPAAQSELNDKLLFTQICLKEQIPVAPILAYVEGGQAAVYASHAELDRDLLVKARKGRGGRGHADVSPDRTVRLPRPRRRPARA